MGGGAASVAHPGRVQRDSVQAATLELSAEVGDVELRLPSRADVGSQVGSVVVET